ncbi:hypothetical protein MOX02_59850 [Methylobacterium oxalidis]|uniref:Uncharacterized protein n=1 Tax=Methylobacterium oxalidis TaxID=944322 RepID=A0A512JDF2_9HYPH|nr:hypothetical protein MOX02_59850 [Methylobacterium oxalidis]GLS62413.1 hypothetical protein GCM10007888_07940 [Methylobacterium oxalidis]
MHNIAACIRVTLCYGTGMQKPLAHPFTITVAADKPLRSTYSWAVWQHGGMGRKQSVIAYATFEEARLAGKAALDEMVATWRREAVPGPAA